MLSSAGSHPFPSVPTETPRRVKNGTPLSHAGGISSCWPQMFRITLDGKTWRWMRVSSCSWKWWGKQRETNNIIHWFLIIFTSNGNFRRLYAHFWTDPPWLPLAVGSVGEKTISESPVRISRTKLHISKVERTVGSSFEVDLSLYHPISIDICT